MLLKEYAEIEKGTDHSRQVVVCPFLSFIISIE